MKREKTFLINKLEKVIEVETITYLQSLPLEIRYFTWSTGDAEYDREFKIIGKYRDNKTVVIYAQTKSIFGFPFRALFWIRDGNSFRRIKLNNGYSFDEINNIFF